MTFEQFGLTPKLNQALADMGFTTPSPIQEAAIPSLMQGKDIVGQAQTGTGKTAAFGIPIIEKIDIANRTIQAAVICPTRELALQVTEEFRKLAKYHPGLSIVCVYGGQPMQRQLLALQNKPQIIVGTPGRLIDHLWRGSFDISTVETIVLDEADEMLNMGFRDDIEKIFDFIPMPRQTVLFSATMPKPIKDLAQRYQQNPEHIRVEPNKAEIAQITQSYVEVSQKAKPDALAQLIRQYKLELALVFCNTKHQVDSLALRLSKEGFAVEGLHGGKAQNQRERILGRFRRGQVKILVATDVAARGIDIRNIQAIVNYDLPEDVENYIHRIGRTGRAGQSGLAFSLIAGHQIGQLKLLQQSQNNAITREHLAGIESPNYSDYGKGNNGNAGAGYDPSKRRHRPRRRPGGPQSGRSGVLQA